MKTELTAGTDEAGRGPLAGPVYAAAVILDPHNPIDGLTDSKKLSAKRREELFEIIIEKALAYAIAPASVEEIEQLNILHASMLAMKRSVEALDPKPAMVLVDGNRCPELQIPSRAIIKGDLTEPCISAASILAKVSRDRLLIELDLKHPEYGFAQHKGYGTKQHLEAISKHGPLECHRKGFAPIKNMLVEGV